MVGQGVPQVGERGVDGKMYCWAVHFAIINDRALRNNPTAAVAVV